MSLRVYNTLTRQKELFSPVHPGKVNMYLCGPTVYKPPHIGHMVGPVIFDAIKRYLQFKGFNVHWVVNITDVDDKLIAGAAEEKVTMAELADKYTAQYLQCLSQLGIDTIDQFPKASEHIPEIIALCQRLIDAGYAYRSNGNVWFDVTRDADYGKLTHNDPDAQAVGNRELEDMGKRNPADFALWKAAKPGEPQWSSPWGNGRPGWHIECSAMSMKYLGQTLDIHGGGMDLKFPHHENEIAQSECATGQPFAKYWLHNGLTKIKTKLASGQVKDEKMSKSLGNVVSAQDAVDRYGAELMRYLLLSTHYRRPIDFSDEVITSSRKGLSVFARLIERLERLTGKPLREQSPDMDEAAKSLLESEVGSFVKEVLADKMRFLEMMDDDFNTAGAIAVLHEMAGSTNALLEQNKAEATRPADVLQAAAAATQSIRKLGQILGLFRADLPQPAMKEDSLTEPLMQLLIQLRDQARKTKQFAFADRIRDGLSALGIVLEDRPDGTAWRKD